MRDLSPTPGQTIGPFYGFALPYAGGPDLVPPGRADAIRIHGIVTDGDGAGVPDALLELWQADAHGLVPQRPGSLRRDGWTFTGFGRAATADDGSYGFTTVRPGPVEPGRTPYVALTVFARGLLDVLLTRAYLPAEVDSPALTGDPLLASLPADRRATLVAEPEPSGYRFDVRLQGERETVFLAHR